MDVGRGLGTKQRPELLKLFEYVLDPANGVTDVMFDDLSRLTRRSRHQEEYIETLEEAGITLHSVNEGRKYSSDSRVFGR